MRFGSLRLDADCRKQTRSRWRFQNTTDHVFLAISGLIAFLCVFGRDKRRQVLTEHFPMAGLVADIQKEPTLVTPDRMNGDGE